MFNYLYATWKYTKRHAKSMCNRITYFTIQKNNNNSQYKQWTVIPFLILWKSKFESLNHSAVSYFLQRDQSIIFSLIFVKNVRLFHRFWADSAAENELRLFFIRKMAYLPVANWNIVLLQNNHPRVFSQCIILNKIFRLYI